MAEEATPNLHPSNKTMIKLVKTVRIHLFNSFKSNNNNKKTYNNQGTLKEKK